MILKPITAEEVLADDHAQADDHSIGGTESSIAGQTITTEDGTADDGLQQIVGKTHSAEDAEVMKYAAHTSESIPGRDYCRDNHQQDQKTVDGGGPQGKCSEVDEA